MSKSVFVMDTPVNCDKCMWFRCSNIGEWFQRVLVDADNKPILYEGEFKK